MEYWELLFHMKLPKFKNQKLFEQAFTHSAFLNETEEVIASNERLEFLGDSILSFVVSEYLFVKYPDFEEGTLTNLRSLLVNTKSLAMHARSLDFGNYLRLSRGEIESKGRENQSLLADSFEAFIGALFIDAGMETVSTFIKNTVLANVDEFVQKKAFKDPKSLLQEHIQAIKRTSPIYKVLEEVGPPHAKIFTVGVFMEDKLLGKGEGKSKQEAEESAAMQGLAQLKP